MRTGTTERATRKWTTEAAGLPCTIELTDDRCWLVTIACASASRRDDLSVAIVEASGGLVSNAEATELEAAIKMQQEELGRAEPLTARRLRQTGTGR
jgi:hypothetical protein